MTVQNIAYDSSEHPYMASKYPHANFFIRTPEAKMYRVEHGRGKELLNRLPDDRPLFGVEVGVNEGYLSNHLLARRLGLTLWMIDHWERQKTLTAFGIALCQTDFASHRRVIMRRKSVEVAALIPDGVMDFVFIDASHKYWDVIHDIEAWKPKLKPDGLLCGHDIHMKEVLKAVDELVPGWEGGEDAMWFAPSEAKHGKSR